ncbi:MAG: hypothetical protein HYY04_12615 [Chloroflexi bacterium]|nr:hypothetical protein [Chloroflexota bacterium]
MLANPRVSGRLARPAASGRLATPADHALVQRLVWTWLRLAVGALTIAGLFVVPVLGGRLPLVQSLFNPDYFRLALVTHVTFSLNVWLIGFAAVLWTLAAARLAPASVQPWTVVGPALAVAGALALAATAVGNLGAPLLADYVPMLAHPLYYGGLALFFGGVGLVAAQYVVVAARASGPLPAEAWALQWAAVVYLLALLSAAVAWNSGITEPGIVVWGAGHLLQIVNAAVLIAAWRWLLGESLSALGQAILRAVLPILAMPAVVIPWLHVLPGPVRAGEMALVAWWGVGVPLGIAWAVVVAAWLRQGRPADLALLLSLGFFGIGGVISLLGMESDVRVTAHYHSMVGAVTVAYMGMTYRLTSQLAGRVPRHHLRTGQFLLYGAGIGLLVAGLFWAGRDGSARKVFEAFSGQLVLASPAGLVLIGSLLAAVGGIIFVATTGPILAHSPTDADALDLAGREVGSEPPMNADGRTPSPPTLSHGERGEG